MSAHFVGSPYPIPSFNSSPTETSLIVRQFLALARGEVAVQVPANGFRAEAVKPEEHYCLKCLGVRWFDVVYGVSGITCQVRGVMMKWCRGCGAWRE